MTTRRAYRVVGAYSFIGALLFGGLVAAGPNTGWITTAGVFGCAICIILTLYLLTTSFSADPKRQLDGFAITILIDLLLR